MKLNYLQQPTEKWYVKLPISKEYPRHWITIVDIEVTLSDGYILKRPKGTIWDGASIPKWLWWLIKPMDTRNAFANYIHDMLWTDKQAQFAFFKYNIFKARLFADNERMNWLSPETKNENKITNFVIRAIGGFYYSNQLLIPN